MIFDNKLYFTRIDCFDDPLEGLSPDLFLKLDLHNQYRFSKTEELQSIVTRHEFDITKSEIDLWKKGCFVSCWYLTAPTNHDESFSQWQLYCDKYSFAIKIKFNDFLFAISDALKDFEDEEIELANFGRVEYLSLYEQATKNATMRETYIPSYVKHTSYSHENELRFLLQRKNGNDNRKGILIKLKQEFSNIKSQIEIIAHPDMDIEVFSLFKKELNVVGFNLICSRLITKNNINHLIQ